MTDESTAKKTIGRNSQSGRFGTAKEATRTNRTNIVERSAKTGKFIIKEGTTVRGGVTTTQTLASRPKPPAPNKVPPAKPRKQSTASK